VADAGPDAEVCSRPGIFNIAGTTSANGSILWTTSGDGRFDNNTLDNPSYTLGTETDSVFLIKTVTSAGSCIDAVDSMILSVTLTPVAIAGSGGRTCDLEFQLGAVAGESIGKWTKTSGPGTVDFHPSPDEPNAWAIVSDFGLYVFTWTVSNRSCTDTSSVQVDFTEMIEVDAGAGGSVCGLSFDLGAIQGIGSGIWSKVTGPGQVTFTPSDTLFNATATVDQSGTYLFQWSESFSSCKGSDTVEVSYINQPKADAGPDQILEFVFSTHLEGNFPEFGRGRWTLLNGTGQLTDENDPLSEVTGLSLGDNEFAWSIVTGVCEDVTDNVLITVRDIQTPTVITPNNDGLNDFLEFPGITLQPGSELIIYNRWGTEVYRNRAYQNDWNGKDHKGRDLINDTYFYVLKLPSSRIIKSFVEIRR
jgi:gliding motility-associated-like protein